MIKYTFLLRKKNSLNLSRKKEDKGIQQASRLSIEHELTFYVFFFHGGRSDKFLRNIHPCFLTKWSKINLHMAQNECMCLNLKCKKSTAIFRSAKYRVSSVLCFETTNFTAYGAKWHISSKDIHLSSEISRSYYLPYKIYSNFSFSFSSREAKNSRMIAYTCDMLSLPNNSSKRTHTPHGQQLDVFNVKSILLLH